MAVANHALAGEAVLDNRHREHDVSVVRRHRVERGRLRGVRHDGRPDAQGRADRGAVVGQLRDARAVLAAGSVDALCEQLVAGADRDGDVVVLCGTTLIVWVTIPEDTGKCPACGRCRT